MSKDSVKVGNYADEVKKQAGYFSQQLHRFFHPLAEKLDNLLDSRLVGTFVALLGCILRHRHNSMGLLLSELEGKLLGESSAPASTKRITNLLRSKNWSHSLIEQHLLEQAQQQARDLQADGQVGLLLWDESVVEKPESIRSEGLCAVARPNASSASIGPAADPVARQG